MKRQQLILISIFIIFQSAKIQGQTNDLQQYDSAFKSGLKNWFSTFKGFSLSNFVKDKTEEFENIDEQDFSDLKEFYSIYKPLLVFSPDRTKFIDIYSYQLNLEKEGNGFKANPEIDQSIRLCDFKTNIWKRILFKGSDNWIEEVFWLSNTKFILAGIELNKERKRIPEILIADTKLKSFDIYKSSNKNCIQKELRYKSSSLKKMKIKGL